jgi:L-ribulokinase
MTIVAGVCPSHTRFEPQMETRAVYDELYQLYRTIYFGFGDSQSSHFSEVLPRLIATARGRAG